MKIQSKNDNMSSPKIFNFTPKQEEQKITKNNESDTKPENALYLVSETDNIPNKVKNIPYSPRKLNSA